MMADGWDIGTLNDAYFVTIDAILSTAQQHGIYCMLTPLSECQWTQENINRNSVDKWRTYGLYLGRRYKGRANIIWQFGNDHINEKAQHAIVQGIKAAGDIHLMTINWRPGFQKFGSGWVRKHEHGESWIDLDAWYRNGPISGGAAPCYWQKIAYERPNPMPSFQTEAAYQQPDGGAAERANATDLACRMQNYYVALGGGCGGHVYGAGWLADAWDYNTYKNNGGRFQAIHFKNLIASRDWISLVPDYRHGFITAGYGTLSPNTVDYVGAAMNPSGTLGMAYWPKATTITADLSKFAGPVRARWYDPTNGHFGFQGIKGSPLPNTGPQQFTTPGANIAGCEDWVLVLESQKTAAQVQGYSLSFESTASAGASAPTSPLPWPVMKSPFRNCCEGRRAVRRHEAPGAVLPPAFGVRRGLWCMMLAPSWSGRRRVLRRVVPRQGRGSFR